VGSAARSIRLAFASVETATRKPAGTIRLAAFLFILSGGIALTTPLVLLSFDRNGYLPEAPFDLGFELLAGPFSENLPSGPFITLGVVLTAVSILDVVAGVMLWMGLRSGGVLGFATSPIAFALGIGFAVPFLLVVTVLRAALVVAGWSSLHPQIKSDGSRSSPGA
jgi:hypothetical protein